MLAAPETEIFDTGCVNTFFNESPTGWTWLDATDSQRAIVEIDDTMFSTADGDPWAYKLRVVIYPLCDGADLPSSSSFFSLSMSCIGCGCDGCDCGAQGCASYESFRGKWTTSGRGQPSGCGSGGGGESPPALRSASTCPDLLNSSARCSFALTTTEAPPGRGAEISPDADGEFRAYATSCCYGRSVSCAVPFYPNFSNAIDSGCASWELVDTCTQDDVTTRMWKPIITSCELRDGSACVDSTGSPCSHICETCCRLCFAVGTRVLLDNGKTMAVEEISVGDRLASVEFRGVIPNPSFTDLLDGWRQSPAGMVVGSSVVTSAILGYEQGRTSVGSLITVSPEHPMLVMRKDGDVSFVSASLLTAGARLVRPDGSTQAAGEIVTTSKATVTVSIEMSDATCVVANGVVCHVGVRGGSSSALPEAGFDVDVSELNSVNAAIVGSVLGDDEPSVFSASSVGESVETTKLDPDQFDDTIRGVMSGGTLPEGCTEQCSCTAACTSPCGDGSILFAESYGGMPCCDANPVGSLVVSVSLSTDNLWLMQHVLVSNGGDSQSIVTCRPVDGLCEAVPVVLSIPSSSGLPGGMARVSESIAVDGGHLFSVSGGGGSSLGFMHDGSAFRQFGSSGYGDGNVVVHSVPTCLADGSSYILDLVASPDSSFVSIWNTEGGATIARNIVEGVGTSADAVAVVHAIGSWSMCLVGGDGHLSATGFYADDASTNPWWLKIQTPTDANGNEIPIGNARWIPFGARDGDSMVVVAVPLESTQDIWIFRARREGSEVAMQCSTRAIPRPATGSTIWASGLQGKFLVSVEGAAMLYEYDSTSGAILDRDVCVPSSSAISCSKSHDLQAVVHGDLIRCSTCSGSSSPCNLGAVSIRTCGSICTGKQFVVSCEI